MNKSIETEVGNFEVMSNILRTMGYAPTTSMENGKRVALQAPYDF